MIETEEELTVVLNLAKGVRYDSLADEAYLVAPVTLLVPGTLNGSQGPTLYEVEDIEESELDWNGVNILLGHPKDGRAGADFDSDADEWLGFLDDTKTENGKLVGEAWFALEKLRRNQPELLTRIQAGKQIEVSTGLRISAEDASGVDQRGRPYNRIARNYQPDHLAILIDQLGACSVQDGCGVNNERSTPMCTCANNQQLKATDQSDLIENHSWDFDNPCEETELVANNGNQVLEDDAAWQFANPLK